MTGSLRDAFDELVAEVAPHVVRNDLATRARIAGRRRRIRGRLAGGVIVAAMLAVSAVVAVPLVGGVPSIGPSHAEDGPGVTGRPQRIGHQWWVRDLPDRPGPIAALVSDPERWYVVTESGHRWRLPIGAGIGNLPTPVLAPDGRRVGYQPDAGAAYVVHNLVTGERTRYPQFENAPLGPSYSYYSINPHLVGRWSPDGLRLGLPAERVDMRDGTIRATHSGAAVLGPDGQVTFVEQPSGQRSVLAGWAGPDSMVWLRMLDDGGPPAGPVVAEVTRLDGQVTRTVTLRPSSPWREEIRAVGIGPVSPDGTSLLVREDGTADRWLRRFSLADGSQTGDPVRVPGWTSECGSDWAGSTPVVSLYDRDTKTAGTGLVVNGAITPMIVVESRLNSECLVWASEALAGRPHPTVFGTSDFPWTWWWRETVLVLLAVIGLWLLRTWVDRRSWSRIMRENARWRRDR
ncbi:hypothetical protein [Dactylosporangium sp. NPDC048998]|uniref:hypothetical protein n=1 Tax=Dactylosporangium sp. NPDC048998 TaxID=3363976 RepID=UPI003716CF5D